MLFCITLLVYVFGHQLFFPKPLYSCLFNLNLKTVILVERVAGRRCPMFWCGCFSPNSYNCSKAQWNGRNACTYQSIVFWPWKEFYETFTLETIFFKFLYIWFLQMSLIAPNERENIHLPVNTKAVKDLRVSPHNRLVLLASLGKKLSVLRSCSLSLSPPPFPPSSKTLISCFFGTIFPFSRKHLTSTFLLFQYGKQQYNCQLWSTGNYYAHCFC